MYTPCNYCTLRRIRERAADNGQIVTVIPLEDPVGSAEAHVHLPTEQATDNNVVAWFMLLPDHCCC